MTTLLTATGRYVDIDDLCSDDVDIRDIAASLSKLCRFNGHCRAFYSVAQHSLLVRDIIAAGRGSPRLQLLGLLHDAHEAYTGDIIHPMKMMGWRSNREFGAKALSVMQDDLQEWIEDVLLDGCPGTSEEALIIKHADLVALATERRDLMPEHATPWPVLYGIEPHPERIAMLLDPVDAERSFLAVMQHLSETSA